MSSIVTKNVDPATVPTPASGKTAFGTNLSSDVFIKDDTGAVTVITSGGTVTSVGVSSTDSTLSVSGSPVTTSGTIDLTVNEANLDLANIGGDLDLTTQVGTSVLPIANGGTGQATANAALNALLPSQATNNGKVLGTDGTDTSWVDVGTPSPLTTKGDLYTYTTTEARLPVGTDGQILSADSAEASGLKWIAAPDTSPAGSNTQVQFNNSGVFGASADLTFSGTTLTVGSSTQGTLAAATSSFITNTDGSLDVTAAGNITVIPNSTGTTEIQAGIFSGDVHLNAGAGKVKLTQAAELEVNGAAGTSGQVLTSQGAGAAPIWSTPASGSPAGSDTQIQFNDGGSFGATANFTYSDIADQVTLGTSTTGSINIGGVGYLTNGTSAFTIGSGTDKAISIAADGTGSVTVSGASATISSNTSNVTLDSQTSLTFLTGNGADNFTISAAGAWNINGVDGTAGQVLTSQGSSGAPVWSTPSGSGTVTSVDVASGGTYAAALSVSGGPVTSSGTITVTPNLFTSSDPGVVPASGGGTSNYLRADGTWATPAGGGGSSSNTYKEAVRAATTANITLSGNVSMDGITTAPGDRILVKNQSSASQNGIYIADSGAWARASDFDTSGDEVANGAIIPVQFGTVNGGSTWQLVQNGGTIGNSFRFAPLNGIATYGQATWTTPSAATAGIAIGNGATSGTYSVAIGEGANNGSGGGSGNISIGWNNTIGSGSFRNYAIGDRITGTGNGNIAIGRQINVGSSAGNVLFIPGSYSGVASSGFGSGGNFIAVLTDNPASNSYNNVGNLTMIGRDFWSTTSGASPASAWLNNVKTGCVGIGSGRHIFTASAQQSYSVIGATYNNFGSSNQGFSIYTVGITTSNDTPTLLQTLNTAAPWGRIVLAYGYVYAFDAQIVGSISGGANVYSGRIKGCIKNIGGTVSMVGTPVVSDEFYDASWTPGAGCVAATANNTNKSLDFTATGAASTQISWVARVEMKFLNQFS